MTVIPEKKMVIVDVADMAISKDPQDTLVTYALGSCLGVMIYDPVVGVGGMIHCMLPLSEIDTQGARSNPAKFIDTGVPALFRAAYQLGAKKERLIVKVAGGACIHDERGWFKIGERNYHTLRKMLWQNRVVIDAEDVGGMVSRTVYLDLQTGEVKLRIQGEIIYL